MYELLAFVLGIFIGVILGVGGSLALYRASINNLIKGVPSSNTIFRGNHTPWTEDVAVNKLPQTLGSLFELHEYIEEWVGSYMDPKDISAQIVQRLVADMLYSYRALAIMCSRYVQYTNPNLYNSGKFNQAWGVYGKENLIYTASNKGDV